jgi:hypothetical protein
LARCWRLGCAPRIRDFGGYETFDALPRIVEGLRRAGYGIVTLDEMFGG